MEGHGHRSHAVPLSDLSVPLPLVSSVASSRSPYPIVVLSRPSRSNARRQRAARHEESNDDAQYAHVDMGKALGIL